MSATTLIKRMSDDVTGTFHLRDLLSIHTLSGSIDITIVPESTSTANVPAKIDIYSVSGSIKVNMAPFLKDPSTLLPERVLSCSIKSTSGKIRATLVHNHQTYLDTVSGDIDASIYPLHESNSMSHIEVHCVSGSASVTLHPLVQNPQSSLRVLSARFISSSGTFMIRFPSTWEGEIISRLMSGRTRHEWEGLRILEEGSCFRASNGNGAGQLYIRGLSTNVELMATRVAGLLKEEKLWQERERVLVVPGAPGSPREAGPQESTAVHDSPEKGLQRHEEVDDDDDDWTIVEDEHGDQMAAETPPPSYEDAVMR